MRTASTENRKGSDVEYAVRRQTEAAKSLISSLHEQGADDDAELVADAIEGETDLVEAIAAAMTEIDECEVMIAGLKVKEAEFEARRKMIERRAERVRALVEQAMLATDQKTMKLPTATISLTQRAPGLVITSEADIPSRFFVEQERPAPKLDKKALAAAIKEGQAVHGANLDNGSVSLSVRRK